jgi:hypothetical protein
VCGVRRRQWPDDARRQRAGSYRHGNLVTVQDTRPAWKICLGSWFRVCKACFTPGLLNYSSSGDQHACLVSYE